jgi:hypothetical protein
MRSFLAQATRASLWGFASDFQAAIQCDQGWIPLPKAQEVEHHHAPISPCNERDNVVIDVQIVGKAVEQDVGWPLAWIVPGVDHMPAVFDECAPDKGGLTSASVGFANALPDAVANAMPPAAETRSSRRELQPSGAGRAVICCFLFPTNFPLFANIAQYWS